jgi:hypothetical protein
MGTCWELAVSRICRILTRVHRLGTVLIEGPRQIDDLTANGKGIDGAHRIHERIPEHLSEAENDKRLGASADALDAGGHGPTLDTSIAEVQWWVSLLAQSSHHAPRDERSSRGA